MALTDVLTLSFHPCQGLLAWVYPILRLGIYEDLRQRLTVPSNHYICLAAVVSQANTSLETSDRLIGTVELGVRSLSPWPMSGQTQFVYISNLAVHPHYRRLGVGQQLLLSCEFIAQKWGFSDLYLHVLEDNHQAMQLYTRMGYQLKETQWSLNTLFFQQPRRCFLRKPLSL